MLLEKNNIPAIGEIVTVKLLSGEEIVGKLVERTADSVYLGKPIQIQLQQVSQTQMGITFAPVLASVKDDTIQVPLIALAIRPLKTGVDVEKNYREATSSIKLPTAQETSILTS
jgi:hypothetical protein